MLTFAMIQFQLGASRFSLPNHPRFPQHTVSCEFCWHLRAVNQAKNLKTLAHPAGLHQAGPGERGSPVRASGGDRGAVRRAGLRGPGPADPVREQQDWRGHRSRPDADPK